MTEGEQESFKHGGSHDYTDGLAKNQHIEFFHVPSGKSVLFKAFIDKFSDKYSSEWNEEDAYGRMDPIPTFKRTRRIIELGWDVPAASFEEAKENLRKSSILMSMLYPLYETFGDVNVIKSPPIFKIKFMNLATNHMGEGSRASDSGLLGYVDGFTYEPDFNVGIFDSSAPLALYPKLVKFSCNFKVLHQNELGWDSKGNHRTDFNKFPYSTDVLTNIETPPVDSVEEESAVKNERTTAVARKSVFSNNGTLV